MKTCQRFQLKKMHYQPLSSIAPFVVFPQQGILEIDLAQISFPVFQASANDFTIHLVIEIENLELPSNCPFLVSNQLLKYTNTTFSLSCFLTAQPIP